MRDNTVLAMAQSRAILPSVYDGTRRQRRRLSSMWSRAPLTAVVALLLACMGGRAALAGDAARDRPILLAQTNEDLMHKLEAMEQRIKMLEGQLEQKGAASTSTAALSNQSGTAQTAAQPATAPQTGNKDIFGIAQSPIEGFQLGAYGEFKFGRQQNPSANGQWQNGADLHRLVLLPTYKVTDDIIFHAEIEYEHAGIAFDNDDKTHGAVEIEQAYLDFKYKDWLNFRSPGIDLVPVGYTNLYHEPTLFYSVKRPELANGLIPSTWAVPSTSVFGKIVDNLNYQFQFSSGLEDFGDSFDNRNDSNIVTTNAFTPGIDGKKALANSRPPRGDFRQLNNSVASTFRLSYNAPFLPGLAGSSSVYYTPDTTPRGSHDDNGRPLGGSSLTMYDTELRYRVPDSGLEFRGEFVYVSFGNPENLRANNDSDATNNVGKSMYGYSGEIAYHTKSGGVIDSNGDFVPFYRYTYQDLQRGGFRGIDANTPTGAGQQTFHTTGLAMYPTPKLALKLTYGAVQDRQPGGPKSNYMLGGVGFYF
jgi:hypothetical protein